MNKLLLICLAGAALVALSGAEVSSEEQSVAELSQLREVRAADPGKGNGNGKGKGNGNGKGKGKGKNLKKKGKKNKKGRNLKKSDKKGAGKKKGDKKKKGRKNGAQKGKKNGKKNGKGKNRKNGAKKNNKKQKGLKKSRKNKANGAGKNKDKKKARKAAKKADKKEKKKARKQEKKEQKKSRKNRKNNNNRVNIGRSSCMNATCIDNAVTYMKQLKLAVKNFGKQYNRISTNAKQSSGKSNKYDEFAPYLIKLRETGGGNASNLTCNGEKNQGATNLKTLYDNLATCETIINSTCDTGMPHLGISRAGRDVNHAEGMQHQKSRVRTNGRQEGLHRQLQLLPSGRGQGEQDRLCLFCLKQRGQDGSSSCPGCEEPGGRHCRLEEGQ